MNWPDNNVIAAACSAVGGALSVMLANRVKRSIARDESLLRGYDNFAQRLNLRVDTLEKELDRREIEYRRLLNDAETQNRRCETECAALRRRVDDLERRSDGRPEAERGSIG